MAHESANKVDHHHKLEAICIENRIKIPKIKNKMVERKTKQTKSQLSCIVCTKRDAKWKSTKENKWL